MFLVTTLLAGLAIGCGGSGNTATKPDSYAPQPKSGPIGGTVKGQKSSESGPTDAPPKLEAPP